MLNYYSSNPPGLLQLQKCIVSSYSVNTMCIVMVTLALSGFIYFSFGKCKLKKTAIAHILDQFIYSRSSMKNACDPEGYQSQVFQCIQTDLLCSIKNPALYEIILFMCNVTQSKEISLDLRKRPVEVHKTGRVT